MNITGKALVVFGSRTLDDSMVDAVIKAFVDQSDYTHIITALDPMGVCERTKHYAKSCRHGIVLIQVGLDETRAAGMHEARSISALKMGDHMLAIWDGKSRGTAGEIRLASKMGVETTIVRLEPLPKASGLAFAVPDMGKINTA